MVILDVFEFTLTIAGAAFIGTQLLGPLITGTPLFPMFQSWRRTHTGRIISLHDKLDEQDAREHELELEDELKKGTHSCPQDDSSPGSAQSH